MHKRLPATLAALLSIGFANAQPNDSLPPAAGFYLKVNPLAVLEADAGIGFSGEYILPKSRLGVQLEIQPIFFSIYNWGNENGWEPPVYTSHSGGTRGIELRPEILWYLSGVNRTPTGRTAGNRRRSNSRFYLSADLLLKKTWQQRTSTIEISNSTSTSYFTRMATYTDIKSVIGFDAKTGFVLPVSKDGNRWIEIFAGVGLRFKQFNYSHLPAGAIDPLRKDFVQFRWLTGGREAGHDLKETGISVPLGFKYVYRL